MNRTNDRLLRPPADSLWLGGGAGRGIESLLWHWQGFAALLAVVAVYYLFVLSNGTMRLFSPEQMDQAFASMMRHMLHGEFTVGRKAIDLEAFTREGKTYSYFGIFPALLRLPFLGIAHARLARLSCLVAMVIFVALQLRMLLIVHDRLAPASRSSFFFAVMVAATVLSGPQLYLLSSGWIYNEPIFWSAAMGAAFNLVVVRAAFGETALRAGDLSWLSLLAGLALNTRASVGVALCLGAVLLTGWTAWGRHMPARPERRPSAIGKYFRAALPGLARDPAVWLPAVRSASWRRWPARSTLDAGAIPSSSPICDTTTSISATATSLPLFATTVRSASTGCGSARSTTRPASPIWWRSWCRRSALYFASREIGIESPPLSGLVANPLTVILAGIGLYRLWRKPDLPAGSVVMLRLALIGDAAAVAVVCAAANLTLRYRFDMAPFMTLAAFVGYRSVSIAAAGAAEPQQRRLRIGAAGACVFGILVSHYTLVFYKVACMGVPDYVRYALLPFAPFARGWLGP